MNKLLKAVLPRLSFYCGSLTFYLDERYDTAVLEEPYYFTTEAELKRPQLLSAFKEAEDKLRIFKESHGIPGMSCSIAFQELNPYTISLGKSDPDFGVKVHNQTKIRVGELTMTLTALIALDLVRLGFADTKLQVTLTQNRLVGMDLLKHQAGLDDYNDDQVTSVNTLRDCQTTMNVLDTARVSKSSYNYSRRGYFVMGHLLAYLKGESLVWTYDRYFLSQGLSDTSMDVNESIKLFRSRYYLSKWNNEGFAEEERTPAPFVNPVHYGGVNGVISTSYDMALIGQKILMNSKEQSLKDFISPKLIKDLCERGPNDSSIFGKTVSGGDVVYRTSNCLGALGVLYLKGIINNKKVAVAILGNMEFENMDHDKELRKLAEDIVKLFDKV